MLKPEECKADIEEILRARRRRPAGRATPRAPTRRPRLTRGPSALQNVDHYTVRSAAMASGDAHGGNEVWYDRSRLQLHCHGHSFERNGAVLVYQHGQVARRSRDALRDVPRRFKTLPTHHAPLDGVRVSACTLCPRRRAR